MKVFKRKEFFSEDTFPFFIHQYTIRKNVTIPLHTHEFIEMVYVLKGGARHELGGKVNELLRGDVFVLEPGTVHSYTGSSEEDSVIYDIMFDRELLRRELQHAADMSVFLNLFYLAPFFRKTSIFYPYVNVEGEVRGSLEANIALLIREKEAREPGYQLIIKARMMETMALLSRYYRNWEQRVSTPRADTQWIGSVEAFLRQYYRQPVTLEQICGMFGVSASAFSAKFKVLTGKTFIEFKHELQIEEACRLLAETNAKVLDVAIQVGFDDLSHFYRVFRKKKRQTPLQYRKQSASLPV